MNIIGFYTQALGFSHTASKKPCQDNGTYFEKDGIYIAIVCDGHGGDSYVRSDVGSHIATEVAVEKIQDFVEKLPSNYFEGLKGAVTAKPTKDPRLDKQGKVRAASGLSESEMDLLRQTKLYFQESQKHPDIELKFRNLFAEISKDWKRRISQDVQERPFNKEEKEKLGSPRIEKAYGTTLMAAVRTPNYWFAFHIGDGKLFVCDELMQWTEPVPWDCNCFLNTTTSLCGYSPVEDFRYAFDGTGHFPIAFALGSDGIDDTFQQPDLLHKFYSQILCVFSESNKDEATELLKCHLSELSKRGSHDDMSVATIIEKGKLSTAIEYYKILSEVRSINSERSTRKEKIRDLQMKREALVEEINRMNNSHESSATDFGNWWRKILEELGARLKSVKDLDSKIDNSQITLEKLDKEIIDLENSLSDWIDATREHIKKLKEEADKIKETVSSNLMTSSLQTKETVNTDSPNDVYVKANEAMMSEEETAKMEKESEAQAKELLNK